MRKLHRLQVKQLAAMVAIASFGLVSGSFVSAKADQPLLRPTPPSQQMFQPGAESLAPDPLPSPTVTPSPTVSVAAKAVVTKPKEARSPAPVKPTKRSNFKWGVTILPFPFPEKNDLFLKEQFRLAQELNLKAIRVEYSPANEPANQQAIDLAHQYNLQLIFIIPFGPNDIFSDPKLHDSAYNYVHDIVAKHVGQVEIWQLATEVASVAIVDGGHYGVDRVDYPENKYQAVATWLKAATQAVHDVDPNARRMINDQWVHVGFFDRFFAEGGDTDIVGWNWFSDMGTDWDKPVINTKTGQRYKLMEKLKSFHRDIWLTEVNRRGGSNDGNEKAQADYIQKMADKAYADPAIKAFLVFNLTEDQKAPPQERGYGIVNIDTNTAWVAGLKEAFGRYKDLIAAKQ